MIDPGDMRAATIHEYGDASVIAIEELPSPTPRGRELLIAVRYAGVNPVDWKMREGRNRLVLRGGWPKVLGHDFAGEVVATGPRARRFRVGDAIYGMQGLAMGAFATHLVVSEKIVAAKPPSLSFEEAAALPMTSLTSLQALRDIARVRPGQTVVVHGASGGVGISGIQLGKIFGATVTAVCSARNADLVQSVGADHVIDYREVNFVERDETYDVIFDCVGNKSFAECRGVLREGGVFVSVVTSAARAVTGAVGNLFRNKRDTQVFVAIPSAANLAWIAERVAEGRYRPVLDRRFPLAEARAALEYSETGRARGKITLEMPPSSPSDLLA
jgi:NADPH:quinone reductase-like Zn-dependent oxidoreductase